MPTTWLKRAAATLIAALVLSPALAQADGSTPFPRFIEIATAGTGGAYYPVGIAMAEILTNRFATQATAQVTGGALENIGLIQNGSVKIALTNMASGYRGLHGIAPFPNENDRVRGLFSNLTQGIYQVVARNGSGISSLDDLPGKRVSLGPAGGLGVEISTYVFAAAGFGIDDVRATYLSYDESATMLSDGNLDAIVIQTALPNPALRQMEASGHGFTLVSLPQAVIDKVNADYPYFTPFTIPAEMYGSATDILTLNGTNIAIVDRDLPEDVVYEITKAFMESIDVIQGSHPAAKAFTAEHAADMSIELHPGAARYYREIGVLPE